MSVQEIEQAITQLPKSQLDELIAWVTEYHHRAWDKEIEDDLDAGRLDSVIAAAEREYWAGSARLL